MGRIDINEHDTAERINLKDHIEDLIGNGYLTEFVAHETKKYMEKKAEKDNVQGASRNTRDGNV